ncbi:Velvet factor [Purpureocillium lavendulum]|uniref:Velvet factor n=1 Tax=Purpureocillium lavendulum TaxID=1247861 RepID=A0AB34FGF7_9HYPO|nr:Velvet factor [Purpureocillium lavendulum]
MPQSTIGGRDGAKQKVSKQINCPGARPLASFSNRYYAKWDEIITRLPQLLSSHRLADEILGIPVLKTSLLSSELEFRRAYVVLGFLIHGLVWGGSSGEGVGQDEGERYDDVILGENDRNRLLKRVDLAVQMSETKIAAFFRRCSGPFQRQIKSVLEPLPTDLGTNEVLVKIQAVSLNYRDIAMLHGDYPVTVEEEGIPCSDCSGQVVPRGGLVKTLDIGDHVAVIVDLGNLTGRDQTTPRTLGGDTAGVLREYAVFDDQYLGATLACAGVTAWNALKASAPLSDLSSVLLQAGIQPIITSSADAKLEKIKAISPKIQGINYKETPDIVSAVTDLTNGQGVGIVVNNIGPASIPNDIEVLRPRAGRISLVGFLDGVNADWDPATVFMALMRKSANIQAILCGSKKDFEELVEFVQNHKVLIGLLIDKVFSFEESADAFEYLHAGKHLGKVVIRLYK